VNSRQEPTDPPAELRWLTADDAEAIVAASHLFDGPARRDWAERFLAEPTHHICLAYAAGEPIGFVSAVITTHPDKGTEMFLYELAVDDGHQRRGIGRALVRALEERARALGCYGMWVLTEPDNAAALATYRSCGGTVEPDTVMLTWQLGSPDGPAGAAERPDTHAV
jgi:ribosomal protein S18 acetylase RimI-like enzyme